MKYLKSPEVSESYEAKGIAYNTAAIYVIGTIVDALFAEIEQKCQQGDFASVAWQPAPRLILITGANGKQLIRFAQLDPTGRYVRFFGKPRTPTYSSLPLLKATAHDPLDFLRQHVSTPFFQARKPFNNNKKGTGILLRNSESPYSALLILEADQLRTMDIETNEKGHKSSFTILTQLEATAEAAERAKFQRILESSRVVPDHAFNNNTQLTLSPA